MLARYSTLGHRSLVIAVPIVLICFAVILSDTAYNENSKLRSWLPAFEGRDGATCPDVVDWLHGPEVAYPVAYARRDITIIPRANVKRESTKRIKKKLFPKLQNIDLTDGSAIRLQYCKTAIALEVPLVSSEPPNASATMFGLSTTLMELKASIPRLARWLSGSQSSLLALLENDLQNTTASTSTVQREKKVLESELQDWGIDTNILTLPGPQTQSAGHVLSLLKRMYDRRTDGTQWLSIIDINTFFPSISAVLFMLSRYDPTERHYIGAVSEAWWTVGHYGLMGNIRSGVFISIPLVEALMDDLEHCEHVMHIADPVEDYRIMRCISELTDIKLTMDRSLRPLELDGDLSGIFESGEAPLSIYQRKKEMNHDHTLMAYDYTAMHQIADICPSCFLQRWHFDADMILSSGYSIAQYPKGGLKEANLDYMEETWEPPRHSEGLAFNPAEHSVGPTRPKFELGQDKLQHRLIDSKVLQDGSVRQSYLRNGLAGEIDTLLELVWKLES